MPPIRTAPIKPVKTERTHEENQERAYIAASRRSDRSLEARMESARRASDIHKKRTGRALRVSESDVVNEEMYEEEDEDLDSQLRRLTAHVATGGSPDFSRRLHALLATQMHVRMAMTGKFVPSNYPNGAGWAPEGNPMNYPHMQQMQQMQNYLNMQNMQNMQQSTQGMNMANMQTMNPQMMAPPTNRHQQYRQSPYPAMAQTSMVSQQMQQPTPSTAGYSRTLFQQHSSQAPPGSMHSFEDKRRQSLPVTQRPTLSRNSSGAHAIKTESPHPLPLRTQQNSSPISHTRRDGNNSPFDVGQGNFHPMPNTPGGYDQSQNLSTISPLTTTLPAESQAILGPHMDPNDPNTSLFLGGSSSHYQQQFFTYNPHPSKPSLPQSTGMQQTLSPAHPTLDTNVHKSIESDSPFEPSFGTPDDDYLFSPSDADPFGSLTGPAALSRDTSNQGSSAQNNNDADDWSNFIDFTDDTVFNAESFPS